MTLGHSGDSMDEQEAIGNVGKFFLLIQHRVF